MIIITIIEITVIVIVIAIIKIKVIKKKVIRTGEWNNIISLFVILLLYSNVIILTSQLKFSDDKNQCRRISSSFSGVYE